MGGPRGGSGELNRGRCRDVSACELAKGRLAVTISDGGSGFGRFTGRALRLGLSENVPTSGPYMLSTSLVGTCAGGLVLGLVLGFSVELPNPGPYMLSTSLVGAGAALRFLSLEDFVGGRASSSSLDVRTMGSSGATRRDATFKGCEACRRRIFARSAMSSW